MKRLITLYIFLLCITCLSVSAQSRIVRDFTPACDSLSILIKERTSVEGKLRLKAVMKRGMELDFYFTESLTDYPWYKGDPQWFRSKLNELFPDNYRKYRIGSIFGRNIDINRLVTPSLGFKGTPSESKHRVKDPGAAGFVVREGNAGITKGLNGRNIALWHSHGRYYNVNADRWEWQRPCLFQTCEDMFTQGFVLPYLIPMLENAGAYVMLPRERDTQTNEVIADNDPGCGARGKGSYKEKGKWADAGTGFADKNEFYTGTMNPFTMGTARSAKCVKKGSDASVRWTPEIPQRGEYAVYISYRTLPNSTTAAHYTVSHMGGKTSFTVNQKMGGGTWVYLGTFEFDEGTEGYVELDNSTPEGHILKVGETVTADAVRFGGGMGCIARAGSEASDSLGIEAYSVSGLPRYAEGARYWLQWAGADTTVYHLNEGKNDYRDDFMSRGDWVEWISRGSRMNPEGEGGLGIPTDLSLGFHTDAGVTPNDSIVGTLAIYTYKSENKTKLPGGESRMTSREYADMVQSQIVHDIRENYDSLWSRRQIWDRGYRESRTPSCPSMLLELLSHQNFADMKFGLDPSFRFTVSRAVYKGMLKYLSNRYGCSYAVQPLPVNSMGVRPIGEDKALIRWMATEDKIEPTAKPDGYILYTRIGDGAFDQGKKIRFNRGEDNSLSTEVKIEKGKIYSFRIAAYNKGGKSFASETVSIGIPENGNSDKKVLIVNSFDRVGPPSFIDTPDYAGFDNATDSGVPYIKDISYTGVQYEKRRNMEYVSNERPGFGGSYTAEAGTIVAGNTFDYAAVHGKAIMKAGYPFYSCSGKAFVQDSTYTSEAWAADVICGKEIEIFTDEFKDALIEFTSGGRHILISGAYIGGADAEFAKKTLGYKFITGNPCSRPEIKPSLNLRILMKPGRTFTFSNRPNPRVYSVENPDGISPCGASGSTIFRYADSGTGAGICHDGKEYKTVCLGFPIEVLDTEEQKDYIITTTLEFFDK